LMLPKFRTFNITWSCFLLIFYSLLV